MNTTARRILLPLLLGCGITGAGAADYNLDFTASSYAQSYMDRTFAFTLSSDSIVGLNSTLAAVEDMHCGNTGYVITASDQADVVRSSWCHLGQTDGPWPLKAGSYNLRLWNNSYWSAGTYTATLTISEQGGGDSEPNDATATAASLALDTTMTGRLGFYDALDDSRHDWGDYYRITLPASGILNITTSNAATLNGAFGYTLYESDGSTTVRSTSSALNAGDYYILVWTNNASAYGSYTLNASFTSSSSTSALTASATSLTFGNQEVGTSTTQQITLANNGSGTATLSAAASGDFSLPGNTCGSSLAAGASCTLTVGFTPTATGTRTGTLTIQSNGAAISVALSGTGMVTTAPAAGSVIIQTPVTSAQSVNPILIFAPAPSERNGTHNLYVAGLFEGQFYFLTIANWQLTIVPYTGGELPVYMTANGAELYADRTSGGYSAQTWQIPLGDVSSLPGLAIYAGFGRSAEDMLAKNQVQLIYTVP